MPIAIGLRDRLARLLGHQTRVKRDALRQITHDKSLDLVVRLKAQLQLQRMSFKYSSPAALVRRCVEGNRSRKINGLTNLSPIAFRNGALQGSIPGVRRSCW
jgi:ribosomal protein S14